MYRRGDAFGDVTRFETVARKLHQHPAFFGARRSKLKLQSSRLVSLAECVASPMALEPPTVHEVPAKLSLWRIQLSAFRENFGIAAG